MYGYDLSSRSRMLKRGLYCLMKFCSVSSASASVATTSVLDVVDLVGQRRRAVQRRVGEVARDALADRLRLADVDDAAAGVAEQVDAGLSPGGRGAAPRAAPRGPVRAASASIAMRVSSEVREARGPIFRLLFTQQAPVREIARGMCIPKRCSLSSLLAALVSWRPPPRPSTGSGSASRTPRCSTSRSGSRCKLKRVRYIVPWDCTKSGRRRAPRSTRT